MDNDLRVCWGRNTVVSFGIGRKKNRFIADAIRQVNSWKIVLVICGFMFRS